MKPRDLSSHTEYSAGKGIEEVARSVGIAPDDLVVLSSNENALGPSPKAVAAIREVAGSVHRYPKAAHTDLTEKIANYWDVTPSQIWLANGGDGALDYLARALLAPGDAILVPTPGFAYYAMSARYHHGRVNEYELSLDDDFDQTTEPVLGAYDGERIVYLTSPHNPTGSIVSLDTVREIADRTGDDTFVLVDEAYGEFTDADSALSLVADRDDVGVLRTFSKAYGLAGCRLGYAIVPVAWSDVYTRVNTPFAVSEVACRAGIAALDDQSHVTESRELVEWSREYIRQHADAKSWASHGNFVLLAVGDATTVASQLLERGVVVRDCTGFGLPDCIRITCGTREETKRVVRALNEVV